MKKAIKDVFLMGVGAGSLTKKRAKEVLSQFEKKGFLHKKEMYDVLEKVMGEAGKVKKRLVREGKSEMKTARKNVSKKGKQLAKKADKSIRKATRAAVKKGMRF